MDEDERQRVLDRVTEAHLSVSEILSTLRRQLATKATALKAAVKAERELFQLKRQLQQLDPDQETRPKPLAEVTRGGKLVDLDELRKRPD